MSPGPSHRELLRLLVSRHIPSLDRSIRKLYSSSVTSDTMARVSRPIGIRAVTAGAGSSEVSIVYI